MLVFRANGRYFSTAQTRRKLTARFPLCYSQHLRILGKNTPDISDLITEDDGPKNIFSEKQQRLLTEPLYSSWAGLGENRSFVIVSNVGLFAVARNPAIVPDVLLSADVEMPTDFSRKENRSYFLWEFSKPPDIAIEIVSNKIGGEDGEKKQKYARMKVEYYVVYDPLRVLMPDVLTVYHLHGFSYERVATAAFPAYNLSLVLWQGRFEDGEGEWLRWADAHGKLILTDKELADQEWQCANQERQRADQEQQRANLLAEKLRQLGVDPDQL
jgi:Uma2 family endonuclease